MIISLSRWKGDAQNIGVAHEIAPILKRHGATFTRLGTCYAGAHAGQLYTAVGYADWAAYGRATQALSTDADYQRLFGQATKAFELQERSLLTVEDI